MMLLARALLWLDENCHGSVIIASIASQLRFLNRRFRAHQGIPGMFGFTKGSQEVCRVWCLGLWLLSLVVDRAGG